MGRQPAVTNSVKELVGISFLLTELDHSEWDAPTSPNVQRKFDGDSLWYYKI